MVGVEVLLWLGPERDTEGLDDVAEALEVWEKGLGDADCEVLEESLDATRRGGGGASRSRCDLTSPGVRDNGEAMGGRPREEEVCNGVVVWRRGVDAADDRGCAATLEGWEWAAELLAPALLSVADVPLVPAFWPSPTGRDPAERTQGSGSASAVEAVVCEMLEPFL